MRDYTEQTFSDIINEYIITAHSIGLKTTVRELSKITGISKSCVSDAINGKNIRFKSPKYLFFALKALNPNVDIVELIKRYENNIHFGKDVKLAKFDILEIKPTHSSKLFNDMLSKSDSFKLLAEIILNGPLTVEYLSRRYGSHGIQTIDSLLAERSLYKIGNNIDITIGTRINPENIVKLSNSPMSSFSIDRHLFNPIIISKGIDFEKVKPELIALANEFNSRVKELARKYSGNDTILLAINGGAFASTRLENNFSLLQNMETLQ